jgi:ribosome maturation factor RimP
LADLEQARVLIEKVVADEGLELVDVEFKRGRSSSILRLYIDKPAGITLQDCERVSRQVGTLLDVEGLIAGRYTLEVSSPGLTRPLKKEAEYERYQGRLVKIQTREPILGSGNFRGTLLGMEGDVVNLQLTDGQKISIPFPSIVKASLDIDF